MTPVIDKTLLWKFNVTLISSVFKIDFPGCKQLMVSTQQASWNFLVWKVGMNTVWMGDNIVSAYMPYLLSVI